MIPKVIHYIWLGHNLTTSPLQERCVENTILLLRRRGWEFKLWTLPDLEKETFQNQDLMDISQNHAEKSDMIRLEILYKYGGFYIDHDYEFVKDPTDLMGKKRIFTFESDTGYISNAIMGVEPGDPFIKKCIDIIPTMRAMSHLTYDGRGSFIVNTTGPGMLTAVYSTLEEPFDLLPSSVLHPPAGETEGAYGIHHQEGTWWRPKKNRLHDQLPVFEKEILSLSLETEREGEDSNTPLLPIILIPEARFNDIAKNLPSWVEELDRLGALGRTRFIADTKYVYQDLVFCLFSFTDKVKLHQVSCASFDLVNAPQGYVVLPSEPENLHKFSGNSVLSLARTLLLTLRDKHPEATTALLGVPLFEVKKGDLQPKTVPKVLTTSLSEEGFFWASTAMGSVEEISESLLKAIRWDDSRISEYLKLSFVGMNLSGEVLHYHTGRTSVPSEFEVGVSLARGFTQNHGRASPIPERTIESWEIQEEKELIPSLRKVLKEKGYFTFKDSTIVAVEHLDEVLPLASTLDRKFETYTHNELLPFVDPSRELRATAIRDVLLVELYSSTPKVRKVVDTWFYVPNFTPLLTPGAPVIVTFYNGNPLQQNLWVKHHRDMGFKNIIVIGGSPHLGVIAPPTFEGEKGYSKVRHHRLQDKVLSLIPDDTWIFTLDMDEFMLNPLQETLNTLEKAGAKQAFHQFIDVYSDKWSKVMNEKDPIMEQFPYYDELIPGNYTLESFPVLIPTPWNTHEEVNIPLVSGGAFARIHPGRLSLMTSLLCVKKQAGMFTNNFEHLFPLPPSKEDAMLAMEPFTFLSAHARFFPSREREAIEGYQVYTLEDSAPPDKDKNKGIPLYQEGVSVKFSSLLKMQESANQFRRLK